VERRHLTRRRRGLHLDWWLPEPSAHLLEDVDESAADELPDQVDPEKDADLLSKYGIDPQQPLGGGLGDAPSKLGL
jgi:hypothetical protein